MKMKDEFLLTALDCMVERERRLDFLISRVRPLDRKLAAPHEKELAVIRYAMRAIAEAIGVRRDNELEIFE